MPDNSSLDALIGTIFVLLGLFFFLIVFVYMRHNRSDIRTASYLAPTRASEALDPELKLLYQKTRLFELELEAIYPGQAAGFARELRRGIFQAQTERCRHPESTLSATLTNQIVETLEGTPDGVPDKIDRLQALRQETVGGLAAVPVD